MQGLRQINDKHIVSDGENPNLTSKEEGGEMCSVVTQTPANADGSNQPQQHANASSNKDPPRAIEKGAKVGVLRKGKESGAVTRPLACVHVG